MSGRGDGNGSVALGGLVLALRWLVMFLFKSTAPLLKARELSNYLLKTSLCRSLLAWAGPRVWVEGDEVGVWGCGEDP